MSIKGIGVEQSTINAFVNTTEKSVETQAKQETVQPFVATESKRGDEQFYGEMRRSQVESKLNVKSYNSAANSLILEPTKKQAGKVEDFIKVMNESPSKVGQQKGQDAQNALLRLGETEGLLGTEPKNTPYFNLKQGRYIYTKKGGWIDMIHFLFYAGTALQYKQDGRKNPIGDAVQNGYLQERFDPTHSSYSYEDLPTDKLGADFAVNHFDPNSSLTLGEQVEKYLKDKLEATDPKDAPNYDKMPEDDSKDAPSRLNKTTTPVYTKDNP